MDEIEIAARAVMQKMPLSVKFWLIISKLPFISDWRKTCIFMDKVTPWIVSQSLDEILHKQRNIKDEKNG